MELDIYLEAQMKIKNQLIIIIIAILSVGVLIQSFIASKYIDNYFNSYIMQEYNQNIARISLIAQEIIADKESSSNSRPMMSQMAYRRTLSSYMSDPIVEINIYSNQGRLLFTSSGAMGQGHMNSGNNQEDSLELEADIFDVSNDENQKIGNLEIIRNKDVKNWQTSVLFNKALYSGAAIAFISVAIIAGLIIWIVSAKFSKQLIDTAYYASKIEQDDQVDIALSETVEIKQIQLTLLNLASRLKLKTKIRKEKADKLSHETRTPLTILKSNIEAAIDEVIVLDEQNLSLCLEQIDTLSEMMTNISDIITDDSDDTSVELSELDLTKEIKNIIKSLSLQYSKKNIALTSSLSNELVIHSDKNKINQSVYNLLTNAYKFTPYGGKVDISVKKLDNSVTIEVADSGMGVKQEELDKIFTAYYRSNEHKETQGDGLGLYIVSTNMVLLGGSASAYINESKGLTVKLEIPLKHC